MTDLVLSYLAIGAIFLAGLVINILGRRMQLPRVTLMLLVGFAVGPSVLDLLPDLKDTWFQAATDLALMMIGFLLGGHLTRSTFRLYGRWVLLVSLSVVVLTAATVTLATWLAGGSLPLALILGATATATAPAAVQDVVKESHAGGPFTQTLLGIVAILDAWGLVLFSLCMTAAGGLTGGESEAHLLHGLWEIGGAVVVGAGLGIPMAYITGRLTEGEPSEVEAMGFVLLCGGIALAIDVSFILAAMVMGVVVVNLAYHHDRPFHAIEGIEWPFKMVFFLLAGASLEIHALLGVGAIGLVFIVGRVAGRILGGIVGAYAANASPVMGCRMGLSLLPQAGVAIGMALTASKSLPAIADILMPVVIGTTVLFEVTGPIVTRLVLKQAGEITATGEQ